MGAIDADVRILQALAVTAEVTGTTLSPAAQVVMVDDLLEYPLEAVERALVRCRRELTGRLTLAAIMDRLADCDGRPGADEAWAMIAGALADEAETVVWTEEMAEASQAAGELMAAGDKVGARMAFRGAYERAVKLARENGHKPRWCVSAGTDKQRHAAAVKNAAACGKLAANVALAALPMGATEERQEIATGRPLSIEDKQRARALLGGIAKQLAHRTSGVPA